MTFNFLEMDAETRRLMAEEIRAAVGRGSLYYSKRFNATGDAQWSGLLIAAAESHDEHWLAYHLEANVCMKDLESRQARLGGYTVAHVPYTAAQTLADAEFNRYYMCAICRRAAGAGRTVTVYRAKPRADTRAESDGLIGKAYDPAPLAEELRVPPAGRGHPLVLPNSGLSVHITDV